MQEVVRNEHADIVVVGGGPAGVCAAIAAARRGARALLVEQYGFLGGVATTAMFQPWRGFYAFGKQLAGGIAEGIVTRLRTLGGTPGHLLDPTGISFMVTPFDIEILKFVLQEMVLEADVKLLLHAQFLSASLQGRVIDSLRIHCREGDIALQPGAVVDASGSGIVAVSAGAKYLRHEASCSYRFSMAGIDEKSLREYAQKNPHEFSGSTSAMNGGYLSLKGFSNPARMWREESPELAQFDSIHIEGTIRPGEAVISMIRLSTVDPEDRESLTRGEVRSQQLAPRAARFLSKHCPGFSNARILTLPAQIGFHGGRQICGAVTLTDSDVMSGRTFSDAVATCAVPGRASSTFQVPAEALSSPAVENLIVAGRSVLPPTALFGTNNQPASMQLGESAGGKASEILQRRRTT